MFWLKDKTVLITGGTGSFGKRCAQVLLEQTQLRRLILLSRDEQKHVNLRRNHFPPDRFPQVRYFVGDVRDQARLRTAFRGVDFVIHAAAMKHVDMAEYNPQECIATNVGGAQNVIQAAIDCGVRKVVALSTDKAASPINLYGATKLCSDKLFVASNSLAGHDGARFSVVRYGNVLNSNGSVVPFFLKQRATGVLPITDPNMSRFIITLEQGVWFVLDAMQKMTGGEVFVPKIPSVTIMDIARAVAPECPTKIVGIRPGEKLHECMIPADEARLAVEFDDHFVIKPSQRTWDTSTPWYEKSGRPCGNGFSYSSDSNDRWLNPQELRELIKAEYPRAFRNELPQPIVPCQFPAPPNAAVSTRSSATSQMKSRLRIGASDVTNSQQPVLPYSRQSIDESDIRAVSRVLRGNFLTTGPTVKRFESAIAELCGATHAVSFCNGTAALHAAVSALEIGPGDEVIVPAITFVATANAAVYCGAIPVFADVCPTTLLIDPADVEKKITSKTRAIIAVDYAGQTCDWLQLRDIAIRHNLKLIADSCHALGGQSYGRPVARWADLTCCSFHPVKQITTCEGGMVITNNDAHSGALQQFRNHGINSDHHQRAAAGNLTYDMQALGYNFRLSDVHAALGLSQLEKLPQWTAERREIANLYRRRLGEIPWAEPLDIDADATHGHHLFVVRWQSCPTAVDRDKALAMLREKGVQANIHYRPVYQHSFYQELLRDHPVSVCPNAERAFREILSLPIFPAMSCDDVHRVCNAIVEIGGGIGQDSKSNEKGAAKAA